METKSLPQVETSFHDFPWIKVWYDREGCYFYGEKEFLTLEHVFKFFDHFFEILKNLDKWDNVFDLSLSVLLSPYFPPLKGITFDKKELQRFKKNTRTRFKGYEPRKAQKNISHIFFSKTHYLFVRISKNENAYVVRLFGSLAESDNTSIQLSQYSFVASILSNHIRSLEKQVEKFSNYIRSLEKQPDKIEKTDKIKKTLKTLMLKIIKFKLLVKFLKELENLKKLSEELKNLKEKPDEIKETLMLEITKLGLLIELLENFENQKEKPRRIKLKIHKISEKIPQNKKTK